MATQDPAKACVPILKNAAALDAKLKAGDESVKDECVRLYGEGLVMLERAVSAGTYSDKVKAALGKKIVARCRCGNSTPFLRHIVFFLLVVRKHDRLPRQARDKDKEKR